MSSDSGEGAIRYVSRHPRRKTWSDSSDEKVASYRCEGPYTYPYPLLVELYAVAGLHLYNTLQNSSFNFHHLKKFKMKDEMIRTKFKMKDEKIRTNHVKIVTNYYITFRAYNLHCNLHQTFQVQIVESSFRLLDIRVPIAIPGKRGISNESVIHQGEDGVDSFTGVLPDWPAESEWDDETRFLKVDKPDGFYRRWIYLYMRLTFCAQYRDCSEAVLMKIDGMEILEVAVERIDEVEPLNERLNAKRATVYYIVCRDPETHIIEKAVVRGGINERTGCLAIQGKLCLVPSLSEQKPRDKLAEEAMAVPSLDEDEAEKNIESFRNQMAEEKKKSPFDVSGPPTSNRCKRPYAYPFPVLVALYAQTGLHLYNTLNNTSFNFHYLKRFNMKGNPVAAYYITLHACERGVLHQNFEVKIVESKYAVLDIRCPIARLRCKGVPMGVPKVVYDASDVSKAELPNWPSESEFNAGKGLYKLDRSEISHNDWINLYLRLVICVDDRYLPEDQIMSFSAVDVAIQTTEEVALPKERLNAKTAVLYITYADSKSSYIGKAVVRRVINERSGYMILQGELRGDKASTSST